MIDAKNVEFRFGEVKSIENGNDYYINSTNHLNSNLVEKSKLPNQEKSTLLKLTLVNTINLDFDKNIIARIKTVAKKNISMLNKVLLEENVHGIDNSYRHFVYYDDFSITKNYADSKNYGKESVWDHVNSGVPTPMNDHVKKGDYRLS